MTVSASKALKSNAIAYSFVLPNLIIFAVFTLVPMAFAFALSFMKWDGANPISFVGLANFSRLLHDENFRISLLNTLYFVAGTVPTTLVLSLLVAVLLNRKFTGRNFFRAAFFFPYVASLVAVSVVFNMMFFPSMGPVNNILRALGVHKPPAWTASVQWAMPTVMMAYVWRNVGYYMIIYLAALQGVPHELYEAARMDGASPWQCFRKITVPMITPATFLVTILLTIASFKIFDLILVMTGGGPGRATNVLVYTIYDSAFLSFEYGYSSAQSMVLFLIVLLITILQFRGEKKWVAYL
jgi:multiple sugar transport system permease protein